MQERIALGYRPPVLIIAEQRGVGLSATEAQNEINQHNDFLTYFASIRDLTREELLLNADYADLLAECEEDEWENVEQLLAEERVRQLQAVNALRKALQEYCDQGH